MWNALIKVAVFPALSPCGRGRLQRPQRPLACFPSLSLPLMPRSAFIASSLDLNGGMGWEQTAEAESWRRTISRKKETGLTNPLLATNL